MRYKSRGKRNDNKTRHRKSRAKTGEDKEEERSQDNLKADTTDNSR